MNLLKESALETVEQWAKDRGPSWSASDIDGLCKQLVTISSLVTPHVVEDIPLDSAQGQQVLILRVQSAIDDWLVRAAAGLRASLKLEPLLHSHDGSLALGLRSATFDELDAINGMGHESVSDVARALALHPGIRSIEDLDAVPGIGTARLKNIQEEGYLDQPSMMLVSPSLLAFAHEPTLTTLLSLMDHTDMELVLGDTNRLQRHPPKGDSTLARLSRLLDSVQDEAQRRLSPTSGILASQAIEQLRRDTLIRRYRDAFITTDGELVINDAYRDAMIKLINRANKTIRMAHFVATASSDDDGNPASLAVIEALEARVAAGVDVRVMLDRDRPVDPYMSRHINRPVITRLRAAGITVKEDDPARLFHSKLLVSDEKRAILGSHNLTTASITRTHELSVILESEAVAVKYAARFDDLWGAMS